MIVTVFQNGFRRTLRALKELGLVEGSSYHNVLMMKVADPVTLLSAIEQKTEQSTALYDAISRVAPTIRNFDFKIEGEFLDQAKRVVSEWAPQLSGRSFHVRLHRRGTKHDLGTQDTEHLLNDAVLEAASRGL